MASKTPISSAIFFIIDFYKMKDDSDNNDILPLALLYFYPSDGEIKHNDQLDCGGILGVVQYFQRDLFRSIARTFCFQKKIVAHKHFGRHSAFLSVPDDRYTIEEAHINLKHILNLFNMLYGTWNSVQSIYEKDNQVHTFLNKVLTPIVSYVCNQHRSISTLFSTIEYTHLKDSNQKVLLEGKHYLAYLKSRYGLHDGFIGYDDKILYSTCDSDTTFYLQLLLQLNNDLSENLITIPWESEFKLKSGVSLFRIYMRSVSTASSTNKSPTIDIPAFKVKTTPPINIFNVLPSPSENFSSSISDKKHPERIVLTDRSGSSEETGFDTDTMDELSPQSNTEEMSSSRQYFGENLNEMTLENSTPSLSSSWYDESLTDEQKLRNLRSRSSTMSDEMEKTIEIERKNSFNNGPVHRIYLTPIAPVDTDDENAGAFPITNPPLPDVSRIRSKTITSDPNLNTAEPHKINRFDGQVTWKDIPDTNTECERDELVLYVQRNSRMMFVCIIEESLLTDDYLKKLWYLMLSQMANIEAEIHVIPTMNEIVKVSTDVRFEFNENTRLAQIEPGFDGSRKTPSEESTYMALFARTELNRNPERKAIGLSRGSHVVTIDRRLSDRIFYSCRRFQES